MSPPPPPLTSLILVYAKGKLRLTTISSLVTLTSVVVSFCAGVISSLQEQASKAEHVPTVYVDWAACLPKDTEKLPTQAIEVRYHAAEEEIALGDSFTCLILSASVMFEPEPWLCLWL